MSDIFEKGDYYHETQIDPYVYKLIGDPKGKTIYDLGCGNGYISRNLARQGGILFASDVSAKQIEEAKKKSSNLSINYAVHDATNFEQYSSKSFDVVFMNMVIHYVQDLEKLFNGVSNLLKQNGIFIFSTNHFFRPHTPYSEWEKGKIDGKDTLFIRITKYLHEKSVESIAFWDKTAKFTINQRTLQTYVNTMSKYGLYLFHVDEPMSQGFAGDFSKELQESHGIPTFIIFGAKKI